jgi:hypothetical protein
MHLDAPVVVPDGSLVRPPYPYAFVPGMDTNAPVFHKALATIAKQQAAAPVSSMTSTPAFDKKAALERLSSLDQGTLYLLH